MVSRCLIPSAACAGKRRSGSSAWIACSWPGRTTRPGSAGRRNFRPWTRAGRGSGRRGSSGAAGSGGDPGSAASPSPARGAPRGATRELRSGGFGEYLGIRVYPLADGGALVTSTSNAAAALPVQRVDADGSPLWDASVLQPPLAMVGPESVREVFVPPFPTGDGGIVAFRTLVDSVVTPEESHPYFVRAQHLDANGQHGVTTTAVAPPRAVHGSALFPPVPSPMTSSARVRFVLESEGYVELALHDLGGRRLRTLAEGRWSAGEHALLLTRDEPGSASLRPGLYWLRLTASGRADTRELVVLE